MKTRIVTPPAFKEPSERDPSELPECLARLQKFLLDQVEYGCRNFAEAIAEWRDNELWRHFGCESWEEFVAEHIKQPIEWVDHMIEGVAVLDNAKPPKAQDTIAASKQRAIALLENPQSSPESLGKALIDFYGDDFMTDLATWVYTHDLPEDARGY